MGTCTEIIGSAHEVSDARPGYAAELAAGDSKAAATPTGSRKGHDVLQTSHGGRQLQQGQPHLPGASPPARVTPDPWAPAASHQGRLLHRD